MFARFSFALPGAQAAAVRSWALALILSMVNGMGADSHPADPPAVMINEIMYHPPEDRDELQYLELANHGRASVDLSRWRLAKGVEFTFPEGSALPAGGFVVVCRDIVAFRARYGPAPIVAGSFVGRIRHRGERLELHSEAGKLVDAVTFSDRTPWPIGADGYGSSLERICPGEAGEDAANWCSSPPLPGGRPGGSPGSTNASYAPTPLPVMLDCQIGRPEPDKPVPIRAALRDSAGISKVILRWSVDRENGRFVASELPMAPDTRPASNTVYLASVPAQPADRLVRFTIEVRNGAGGARTFPSPTEPRPTFSYTTAQNTNRARIGFLRLRTFGMVPGLGRAARTRALAQELESTAAGAHSLWNSAALYFPPGGNEVRLYDYVHVRPRRGGIKVHFHRDQPFGEMTGINLIFESSPRYVLAEPLAFELYRRAGVISPATDHVRLWVEDRPLGYYLLVEQPNASFLRRQGRDPSGSLYKLLWYGQGMIGQHEKKGGPEPGHDDLVRVVQGLNQSGGETQWDYIQQHFRVDAMVNYCAVSMCIQNWDGLWNNYYAYHDPRPGGKWELIPWDEDKTWGDYDGTSRLYDWYRMPLTFGMNGDRSMRPSWMGGGPFGGASWWRPPGYFAGPLLANPGFRRLFLLRVRDLCHDVFTPEAMGPVVDEMARRLEPEVEFRALLRRQDPAGALQNFRNDIQSFHRQLIHRREFLLQELARQKVEGKIAL